MTEAAPSRVRFADLGPRVASGLALAAIALIDIWAGGVWAAAFVAVVLVLMLWEFHRMVTGIDSLTAPLLAVLAVSGAVAVFATSAAGLPAGIAALAVGGAIAIALGRGWAAWLAGGLAYMGIAMCALIALRAREPEGVLIILWLVLIVVAADVGAYFVGRTVGGAKLWPRVSPGKTWSGAVGGLAVAGLAGLAFGLTAGWAPRPALLVGLGVAAASQAGDLLESAVKRRFAVKDASQLIPGHGGVMDRLDGLMGAVWFYLLCDGLGLHAIEA
jgi:phosphatidate cytidylyltransferase